MIQVIRLLAIGIFSFASTNPKNAGLNSFTVLVAAFRLNGLSSSNAPEIVQKHLAERGRLISSCFPELDQEDCDFLSRAAWKSNNEIYAWFSSRKAEKYSPEFIRAITGLCRRDALDKAETIPFMVTKRDRSNGWRSCRFWKRHTRKRKTRSSYACQAMPIMTPFIVTLKSLLKICRRG